MKKITLFFLILFSISCASQKTLPTMVKVDREYDQKEYEAFGQNFAIATQGPAATGAAQKMFDLGGNIFDAAVAASFVIYVERPQSTGLGGGGFMLMHVAKDKKTYAVDFREVAPLGATKDMYLDASGNVVPDKSSKGIFSVGVPGNVAGVLEVHKKFGTLPIQTVLQPAIELAEKGFEIYPHLENAIDFRKDMLMKSKYAQSIFFRNDQTPKKQGDVLVQHDVAKVLREIASKGREGFYQGWVAQAIVNENKKHGGLLTLKDLQNYQVRWREPVVGDYKGYKIASMSPPSSGGTHIVQILNILENVSLKKLGVMTPESIHWISSSMQHAFADRAKYMGDTDFVSVPVEAFTSKEYAKKIFESIPENQATRSDTILHSLSSYFESPETSHFSLMDNAGNAVAMTSSINYWLGSGVVVEGTGIVLNNEMDDFSAKPGIADSFGVITGEQNAIEPYKRPLSSMSPTIVLDRQDHPLLVLGTPDGARIISCVTEVLLNYFEYKLPLFESVTALRYHHQWYPDEIRVESQGFSPELQAQLEQMGYQINNKNYVCKIQAVANEKNKLHAVSDIRGEGKAFAK